VYFALTIAPVDRDACTIAPFIGLEETVPTVICRGSIWFIQTWLASQSRDLESILGSGPSEGATIRKEDCLAASSFECRGLKRLSRSGTECASRIRSLDSFCGPLSHTFPVFSGRVYSCTISYLIRSCFIGHCAVCAPENAHGTFSRVSRSLNILKSRHSWAISRQADVWSSIATMAVATPRSLKPNF